ncbi:MAG: YabP/YqfC family sporulation protein [Clostridia bacterium]|nr:YabP/YqfC family sporulation protein [Clostridia bacterium]
MENIHILTLDNRKKATITAVSEVLSFSDKEVKLKLNDTSVMLITGNALKIGGFDNKSGNALILGEITLIKYKPKEESVLKKVFK